MNILLVSSDYPPDIGGIAAHVVNLGRALVRRGNRVAVATVWKEPGRSAYEQVEDGVTVKRLTGQLRLGPFRIDAHRHRLRQCVRSLTAITPPDVIHVHGHAWETHAAGPFACRTPVVGTMHSSWFLEKARTPEGRRRLAVHLRRLSACTGPSKELCASVDALGLGIGPATYIPNGIDTETFRPGIDGRRFAEQHGIVPGTKIILSARRIVAKNGVIHFARAFPSILAAHPDAVAVFAGSEDKPYGDDVRRTLREAGVLQNCKFLGAVDNSRMPELLSLATVSVLPSLMEATSIAGLESMACGVPLVGTRVGGIPELIDGERTGLLVPPEDPAALSLAISRLLASPPLRCNIADAALERARTVFSWETIAQSMEDVYRSVRGNAA